MQLVDKQRSFVENSSARNTQSLANYMPGGPLFRAKNIGGSNLRRLLQSFTLELGRVEGKLEELADEYYIAETSNLIVEWENALGIPDECFKTTDASIELRRKQVIAKLALMNLTSAPDFVALAAFFGVRVEILNGADVGDFFPMTFPFFLFGSIKEAKFTMIVHFLDIERPTNAFPVTFPFKFELSEAQFILCLFNELKPVPVNIVPVYKGEV
jgi:hypothetical protein